MHYDWKNIRANGNNYYVVPDRFNRIYDATIRCFTATRLSRAERMNTIITQNSDIPTINYDLFCDNNKAIKYYLVYCLSRTFR